MSSEPGNRPYPPTARPPSGYQTIPSGVDGAATTTMLPLAGGGFGGTFTSTVPTEAGNEEDRRAQIRVVTDDYFRVMGIPVLQGRSFAAADRRGGPPVLVASEGFSKRFWPGTGALGKSIRFGVRPRATIGPKVRSSASWVTFERPACTVIRFEPCTPSCLRWRAAR